MSSVGDVPDVAVHFKANGAQKHTGNSDFHDAFVAGVRYEQRVHAGAPCKTRKVRLSQQPFAVAINAFNASDARLCAIRAIQVHAVP